ncbi:MAG: YlxR family protein [Chloroflexota bacterium]
MKGPRPKHVPQRTCVVCRQKRDKRRLARVVRTVEGGVVIDPTGKRNGRGAYLCDQAACWDKALIGQALEQALGVVISVAEREAMAAFRPDNFGF